MFTETKHELGAIIPTPLMGEGDSRKRGCGERGAERPRKPVVPAKAGIRKAADAGGEPKSRPKRKRQ